MLLNLNPIMSIIANVPAGSAATVRLFTTLPLTLLLTFETRLSRAALFVDLST
jgi:hypothetical protein